MKKLLLAAALTISSSIMITPSFAETTPSGLSADQRVKNVVYNENDVISLTGYYGYQTTIRFAPYEKIQNISIGDSVAWQVVPNNAGNILFIKPVEEKATTNMTVITDRRIYNFELTAGEDYSPRDSRITYMLKFSYPGDSVLDFSSVNPAGSGGNFVPTGARPYAPASEISSTGISAVGAPKDLNFDYSYKGEDGLAPSTVFDNGEFTYFKFRDMSDLPAIFEVDKSRNESVVNYHLENGYVVVESLGRQFTLRRGEDESCVFNDSFSDAKSLFTQSGA
ncbi:MAG: P-type conjugative transfer protein VirB9 [Litorimonas sp.]